MSKKRMYYSQNDLYDTSIEYKAVNRYDNDRLVAFTHNIEDGNGILPLEYDSCDLYYSEIPWRRGYNKFNIRVGNNIPNIEKFYQNINKIIGDKPTILVGGIRIHKGLLPETNKKIPIDLNGYLARAFLYNISEVGLDFTNIYRLIHSLSKKYNCIGDFCCGYGNSGKIFIENKKSAVLSDVNPRCIGYIAENYNNWINK